MVSGACRTGYIWRGHPMRDEPRFQLDLAGYQLFEDGHKVRLERQPMELLILLVGRRGQLVTREEIAEKFWGRDVFIEADQSINRSVRKLRLALKDDPETPRFLETVVGKGYRFIGAIGVIDKAVASSAAPPPELLPLMHARWLAVGLVIVVITVLFAVQIQWRRVDDSRAVRFAIDVPAGATLGHNAAQRGIGTAAPNFAPSPDGRRLAYVMFTNDKPQLWVRRLDALVGQPLAGTDDASFPFWSPDSQSIAFFSAGKLKRIDPSGGPPQVVCEALAGEGGTWNRHDDIIFAPDEVGGLFRVSASGGVPVPLTTLDSAHGEVSHRWPQFLPDGRHFLYLVMSGQTGHFLVSGAALDDTRVTYVGSVDSSGRTLLLRGVLRSQYADGYLLYLRELTLMARAFDAHSLQFGGDEIPIAEQVWGNTGSGRTGFAASGSNVLMIRGGGWEGLRRLAWVDRRGKTLDPLGEPVVYGDFGLSPDGRNLAAYVRGGSTRGSGDLKIFAIGKDSLSSPLTFAPTESEGGFAWSPDGGQIAYASGRYETDLYRKMTTGIGNAEVIVKSPHAKEAGTWSPDGRYLAYTEKDPETRNDIWMVTLAGDRKPQPFLQTTFNEQEPAFSPDGRWMAYTSDKGGARSIYVRQFPGDNREWQIANSEGNFPRWRADGKELFYFSRGSLMAVHVNLGEFPEFGTPVKLFSLPIAPGHFGHYSVSADGERFLIIEQPDAGTLPNAIPLTVVLNWTAALKKERAVERTAQ